MARKIFLDLDNLCCYDDYMIITAKASTIRAAAKRAGELANLTIRAGEAARNAEHTFVDDGECSVRIAVQSAGVEETLNALAARYMPVIKSLLRKQNDGC